MIAHPRTGKPLLSEDHARRLRALDALWGKGAKQNPAGQKTHTKPETGPETAHFDVALVGGGLSLVLAPLLARQGLSVVVLDRALQATPHREWNASEQELQALVRAGLVTAEELGRLIVARYHKGICRWHQGDTQEVFGVLDCAVDAGALWQLAKVKAQQAGVMFEWGVSVTQAWPDDSGVTLLVESLQRTTRIIRARVMVDARGASSPYCRADVVCPTVGGVLTGLSTGTGPLDIDPAVGEILVTTEGVEDGRQHLWEAFPGRDKEVAVYLFYYAEPHTLPAQPLAKLYERFVAKMGHYKRGDWTLLRPTFGIIPGHSRLRPPSKAPHRRIVLVGDAAGRQSPLTFCGFGAMLRSLERASASIAQAAQGTEAVSQAVDDAPVHQVTGVLALMLARAHRNNKDKTNRLLNAAFNALQSRGRVSMNSLLQDTMSRNEAVDFLWDVGQRYQGVWPAVWRQLGPTDALTWAWRLRQPLMRLLPGNSER